MDNTQAEAENQASFWVARPGTSEHQTGLAVDIVDQNYQLLDEKQENKPVQQWLMAHCTEYGFILRYPTGKSEITGIGYEPWHYRYVGLDAAREITEQGLCLEEYLDSTGTTTYPKP
ncbi:MAG: M15 family metallopeptidase [Dysosmobacter sp.]|nr:M15 family metallopeptidase [Dysosmobacter sp.]